MPDARRGCFSAAADDETGARPHAAANCRAFSNARQCTARGGSGSYLEIIGHAQPH